MSIVRRSNQIIPRAHGSIWHASYSLSLSGLEAISKAFTRRKVETMMVEEMQPMGDKARELVPVKTGALKGSIRIEAHFTDDRDKIFVVIKAGGGVIYYGPYVEFGTNGRAAKPFLRPAWDEYSEVVKERIIARLREMVRSELARNKIK